MSWIECCSNIKQELRDIQIGKKEGKLCLFTDDVIFYVENPKDSTHKKNCWN